MMVASPTPQSYWDMILAQLSKDGNQDKTFQRGKDRCKAVEPSRVRLGQDSKYVKREELTTLSIVL